MSPPHPTTLRTAAAGDALIPRRTRRATDL